MSEIEETVAALVLVTRSWTGAYFTRDELKIVEKAKRWLESKQSEALDTFDPDCELHERSL